MNEIVPGDKLIKGIKEQREQRHDTVYCTRLQANKLMQEAAATTPLRAKNVNNIVFDGLDVVVVPRIDHPIVCKKGDVFTLAKEYREHNAQDST